MEAIVLAGGLGTRLRSVVSDVPKPMAPIGGRPFLEYLMVYWRQQGVERFILSVGYLHKKIEDYFGNRFEGAPVEYSVEREALGTGGGLLLASQKLEANLSLVLNGDTFFAVDLDSLRRFHHKSNADMTMAVLQRASENRYGSVRSSSSGEIESFETGKKTSFINGGVYLFRGQLLSKTAAKHALSCSLEKDLFPLWKQNAERLYVFPSHGNFLDIGVPEDYLRAEKFFTLESMTSWRRKHAS